MSVDTSVPELRFPGYSEKWKVNKFNRLTRINQGLQIEITNRFTYKVDNSFFYITNEFLKESSGYKYFIVNPPASVLCNEDDVLMTRTGNTGHVVTNISGAFHNNFFKIDFDRKVLDKNFLVHYLKWSKTQQTILRVAGSSTIPDLNHNDFYNLEIAYSKVGEQIKVGNTFEKLDSLINQHQKKHDKLNTIKKAMLKKMFPKQGETIPEIRFKGFDEEWEEVQLGDVFAYERPDHFIVESSEYSNEYSTPVLTANKGFLLGYTHEKSTYNKPSIIFDDFTLDAKFVDFPYMVKSSAIKILSVKDSNKDDLLFAFHLLNITPVEVLGHARHYISIVQKTKVNIPKKDEQILISNYFKKLDALISQHQQQITKLNNIKQACLKKMFV